MRSHPITTVSAACFTVCTTAALADNNWAFDEAYWKQPSTAGAARATQSDEVRGPYDQVDRYNP